MTGYSWADFYILFGIAVALTSAYDAAMHKGSADGTIGNYNWGELILIALISFLVWPMIIVGWIIAVVDKDDNQE